MKSLSVFALSIFSLTHALPQQRPNDRETRGSVACSEVCGGVFICSRLDPKAGICNASTQDFNARYQKCQCGEASQVFDSWPLKPKMKLQPGFHYCSRSVCPTVEVKACTSETTESASCKELKAALAADRASCACSSAVRRQVQRPDATIQPYSETGVLHILPISQTARRAEASIMPFYSETGVLHIQPITRTTKRAEATIMPVGAMLPAKESGVAHILPVPSQSSRKAEASIMPWAPEATFMPIEDDD